KSASYLAVDIGTTSLKAIEVRGGAEKPQIVNYGVLESTGYLARANQVLQTSSLKIFEADAIELLKTLRQTMKSDCKDALASLPPFSVFTTVLDFPRMQPKEIEKVIAYQAQQYVPLPITEVTLDWISLGEYEDDKGYPHQKVMLISVPQEQVQKYQRIFQM